MAVSLSCGAFADAVDAGDPNLAKLEQKFFQHSFPKEQLGGRLERLEKMVFGEAKEGPEQQRLANLIQAVPNLNDSTQAPAADRTASAAPAPTAGSDSSAQPPSRSQAPKHVAQTPASQPKDDPSAGTKYPAVSAIENKLFNRDYPGEPVETRLARLETKVFGKPSKSPDMVDRVDRLKQSTGIDIANQPPSGSDWDDDEDTFMPPSRPAQRNSAPYVSADGEDGKSFSGRDLRKDMQRAFPGYGGGSYGGATAGRSTSSGGSGSYGMGGGGGIASGSSGSYGFGGGSSAGYPQPAPQRSAMPSSSGNGAPNMVASADTGLGVNQQVAALESEIFGKTYKDPLPARLNRIESTVFPNEKPAVEMSLPDRVNRLTAVIKISGANQQSGRRVAQKSKDPDFPDLDLDTDIPQPAPQRGGLSKIINGIGNLLGGGGTYVGGGIGGFPMNGGLRTDPQTGLLIDQYGSLIDPNTGMVVGRRVQPAYQPPAYIQPYPSFNNGFAPMMPGMGIGGMGMGSGMNFGIGGRSFGGMWP